MRTLGRVSRYLSALALAGTCSSALATPIVDQLFSMRLQNSANSGNRATGDVMFWGANLVNPAATSYGFTRQCPAGAVCDNPLDPDYVRQSLFYRPQTMTPNQYFASRPYDAALTGAWTLVVSSDPTFAAGTNTVRNTPAIGAVDAMPFVQSLSVQGAGLTPTISWTLPSTGPGVDQVRVRIFDNDSPVTSTSRRTIGGVLENRSFQQADYIFERILPATQTSFSITPGDIALEYGRRYSIAIALDHLRPGTGGTDSRSQSFFDFTPIDPALTGGANVFLPISTPIVTTSGGLASAGIVYNFSVENVSPDQVTFIDPDVATGYTYAKGAGDPNFRTVKIATNAGDGLYDIYVFDGSSWIPVKLGLGVNEEFDFTTVDSGGVDQFQVLGIETSAGLSPTDMTAFVTGLTFMTAGNFTGTMTPIITTIPDTVPAPGTLALLAFPIAALVAVRRRAA